MLFDRINPIDSYAYFNPLACLKDIQIGKIDLTFLEQERVAYLFLKQGFNNKPMISKEPLSKELIALIEYAKKHTSWKTLSTFVPILCFEMLNEQIEPLDPETQLVITRQFFDNVLTHASLHKDYLPLLQYASRYCDPLYVTTHQSQLNCSPIENAITHNNIELLIIFLKMKELNSVELGKLLYLSIPFMESTTVLLDFMPRDIKEMTIKIAHFLNRTVLHKAAQHAAILSLLLKQFSSDNERLTALKLKDRLGATPFHCALKHPNATYAILSSFENDAAKQKAILLENSNSETVIELSANFPKTLEIILSKFDIDTTRLSLLQSASMEVQTACKQTKFAYLNPELKKYTPIATPHVKTFFKKDETKRETISRFTVIRYGIVD
jgi:hypothetical protein